ncbi:HAD family hydrolase [Aerosakkonemataceae cyanobacterium BLCC-F154]|uniref:HAD family hydrolase n=1 Tax=Floridaenema fluviatile BLCC-F154 TaxID=3153640 RepID=A0ABV4Y5E9_9CYAN
MSEFNPTILALDFDGVVCDGLIEYFQTSWRSYCKIWHPADETPPEGLAEKFYQLRPVIEVGWEMPILLRALILGVSEDKIWRDWVGVAQQITGEEGLKAAEVGAILDGVRDEWIGEDLGGWLGLHRFYPGVIERLRGAIANSVKIYIITTKEGRFVRQLLAEQSVEIPEERIIGKEYKRPKYEILRELIAAGGSAVNIWFVEDRLKALQLVEQESDLVSVRLFLADWGYNTQQIRDSIANNNRIKLLSLSQFTQDFAVWV